LDFTALMLGLTWYYEWSPLPSTISLTAAISTVEFVPMIWGESDLPLLNQIPAGTKYLLGFNEPNFVYQSNLTPQQAATLWPQLQDVADQRNIKLVSPAVNYCGSPCIDTDPVVWLDKFFALCTNCRVDYIAVHSYVCDVNALISQMARYKIFGKPIWLTEWACGDDGVQPIEVQQAYMQAALQYLDSDPDIFRYAWFSGRSTEIPTSNVLDTPIGVLTKLGTTYISNYNCPVAISAVTTDSNAINITPIEPWIIGLITALCVLAVIVIILVVIKRRQTQSEIV